jgi:hypothetical protein
MQNKKAPRVTLLPLETIQQNMKTLTRGKTEPGASPVAGGYGAPSATGMLAG